MKISNPIKVIRKFKDLPHIYETEDKKIIQLAFWDKSGKLRRFREIKPKKHNGYVYYRIDKQRISPFKLEILSKPYVKEINPFKTVISFEEN